jgi:hypothetical protein
MAKKVTKLTEADLNRIVRKVIKEQTLQQLANNVGLGGVYDTVSGAIKDGGGGFKGLSSVIGGGVSALLDRFNGQQRQRIENIANTMNSLQTKQVVDSVIVSKKYPQINGLTWNQFVTQYKVTPQIIQQAKSMAYDLKQQGAVAKAAPKQSKPLAEQFGGIAGELLNRILPIVADALVSIQKKPVPKRVIVNPKSPFNGKTWSEYVKAFKVTPDEIKNAKAVAYDMQQNAKNQPQAARPTNGKIPSNIKRAQQQMKKLPQATGTTPAAPTPAPPAQLSPEQLKAIEAQNRIPGQVFNSQNLKRF